MAELLIENFSCIDEAKINLARVTILIGPQASGKSVISKLVYFFTTLFLSNSQQSRTTCSLRSFPFHF